MKTVTKRKNRTPQRSGAAVKPARRKRLLFPQASFSTANDRLAINALKRFLAREFPNQVERVFLYGSKARGDADDESDIDLLIVPRVPERVTPKGKLVRENNTFTQGVLASISKFGVNLSSLVHEAAMLKNWTPLYDHIQKEGVELWRSDRATTLPWGWMVGANPEKDREEHVEIRIGLAQEKLKVAQNLFDGGFYNDTISTFYYAMFYASKPFCLHRVKTHTNIKVLSLYLVTKLFV